MENQKLLRKKKVQIILVGRAGLAPMGQRRPTTPAAAALVLVAALKTTVEALVPAVPRLCPSRRASQIFRRPTRPRSLLWTLLLVGRAGLVPMGRRTPAMSVVGAALWDHAKMGPFAARAGCAHSARTPGCAHSARTPAKSWSNFSLSNFRAVGSFGGPKLVQGDL